MHRGFAIAALTAFSTPVVAAVLYVSNVSEPASAVAATPPRAFVGTTSQERAIAFRLTAGGRRINDLRITYRADCGKGGFAFELDDVFFTPVAVAEDGSFSVKGMGKRLTFSGKIVRGRATGTVRVDYQYGGLFTCTTPALRWSAGS